MDSKDVPLQVSDKLGERDLECLWMQEVLRRFQEFKAGNIKAKPDSDVFRDVRIKLQDIR